jgi:hypothetical protein
VTDDRDEAAHMAIPLARTRSSAVFTLKKSRAGSP